AASSAVRYSRTAWDAVPSSAKRSAGRQELASSCPHPPSAACVSRRPKLPVHPAQIKNTVNLTHQVVRWNDLVEIKRIPKLDLIILPSTHHAPPRRTRQCRRCTAEKGNEFALPHGEVICVTDKEKYFSEAGTD